MIGCTLQRKPWSRSSHVGLWGHGKTTDKIVSNFLTMLNYNFRHANSVAAEHPGKAASGSPLATKKKRCSWCKCAGSSVRTHGDCADLVWVGGTHFEYRDSSRKSLRKVPLPVTQEANWRWRPPQSTSRPERLGKVSFVTRSRSRRNEVRLCENWSLALDVELQLFSFSCWERVGVHWDRALKVNAYNCWR